MLDDATDLKSLQHAESQKPAKFTGRSTLTPSPDLQHTWPSPSPRSYSSLPTTLLSAFPHTQMSSSVIVPSKSEATSKGPRTEKDRKDEQERLARARAIAVQHALSIEEKKDLQNKVLDMILTAYDLPSSDPADPANPSVKDLRTFHQCLALFRPSDLDELVSERNIDDRCGYALCKKPNLKQAPKKVWNSKGQLVEKKTNGQWCSKACKDRNNYVRRQLSEEPAWLRQSQDQQVVLLLDRPEAQKHLPTLDTENLADHQRQVDLATERGDATLEGAENITIVEKESTRAPRPPTMANTDILEGLPIRSIGTAQQKKV